MLPRRMMKSHVLLVGLSASHVEAAKNLVLAGIRISLADSHIVVEADLGYNCLLRTEDTGKKRSSVCALRLAEMNPLVETQAVELTLASDCLAASPSPSSSSSSPSPASSTSSSPSSASSASATEEQLAARARLRALVSNYSIVSVAAEQFPMHTLIELDEACRSSSVALYVSMTCGKYGWLFSDVGTHEYEDPGASTNSSPSASSSSSSSSSSVAVGEGTTLASTEASRNIVSSPSLSDALRCPFINYRPKIDPHFFAFMGLFHWEASHGYLPSSSEKQVEVFPSLDVNKFAEEVQELFETEKLKEKLRGPVDVLKEIAQMYRRQFVPTAAIIGGMLAQDARKFITHHHAPSPNCSIFSFDTSSAAVARIP
eukprot:GHVT01097208.1.p1 GENE.GHVT01097208.1~~GHVT01097208.1.p1  ORF type:complete len:372 (+),score=92.84 GHVT01097208.1:460-1575(+)